MQKKLLIILTIFTCWLGIVKAQDTLKLTLSLKDAENYALEHNRSMQNAALDMKKSEKARWQVIASMLPQVNAQFDYQNFCGYSMLLGEGFEIPMNPSGTLGATASIAFSGAQLVGSMISNIAIEMSDINAKQTELDIISSVEKLYISALAMEETIDLLDKSLENLQSLYNMTQNAVQVGVSEQTDADKLSVQVSSLQSSINASARSLEMIYNSLRLQLGCDVNTSINLTDVLQDLINEGATLNLLGQQFDLNNNYSYQLLEKNLELADKQVTLSKMDCLPTISAFYQYSAKTYFGRDAGMNMTPPNMVGASLSIPLWSSLAKNNKIQESQLAYDITSNTFKDTRDALLIQDKQLRYNVSSAYENYNIQKNNIDVTQRVFDNISDKYKYGRASSLDITNASSEIINAQSNYITSLLQLIEAHINLRQLLNIKQ